MPFLRFAADDVDCGAVAVDADGFNFGNVLDLRAQFEGSFDRALGMIFRGPELDAGFNNQEVVLRQAEIVQRTAHEFLKTFLAFEDGRRASDSGAGEQSGIAAVARRIRESTALPIR